MNKRRKSGFTLVEMLVVMTIIAILMGMMFVGLKMLTTGGIDASARKLQAALIIARSMAMKNNCMYSVVFNNTNGNFGSVGTSTLYTEGKASLYVPNSSTLFAKLIDVDVGGSVDGLTADLDTTGKTFNPLGATWTGAGTFVEFAAQDGRFMQWEVYNVSDTLTSSGEISMPGQNDVSDDSWYVIVGHHPKKWNNSNVNTNQLFNKKQLAMTETDDFSFEGSQVGPKHTLEVGSAFMGLSYQDNGGHKWSDTAWGGGANAYVGNYRVTFRPDGTALFYCAGHQYFVADAKYFAKDDVWQVIGIGVEDGGSGNSPHVGVGVNKYTGEVLIKKKWD